MDGLYLGLMSGTSADGIDAALVQFTNHRYELVASRHQPFSDSLRTRIHAIADAHQWRPAELGELDVILGQAFASAALALLDTACIKRQQVIAIGSHGQTIRHQPPAPGLTPFTTQIGDANTIAEQTGIDTIADFRRRDMAAGGQGAPLAPGFHQWAWGRRQDSFAVVNLGGISNLTWLASSGQQAEGFDCGPANTLMDAWCQRHLNRAFDKNGEWAASGRIDDALLRALQAHPFLRQTGPRSTGREAFNLAWLDQVLQQLPPLAPADVQASLCEFTALCITQPLQARPASQLYCCGGGAYNTHLLNRLQSRLPAWQVMSTAALGLAPEWVEASAFAWLAYQFIRQQPGNLPAVTGATAPRVLGARFPSI
ncbi:anhydro-N-acetylmuramic acid kinase [Simiduia agarivorans]|uniref:Anhydro-N-acetylmuramic acid kinase n=1 Tax=Simiduia agarivorans (strain DSM 21679 / JCM 13881 / BCRC 17597 / SA1) TaxID=1117647 RepID=K4KJ45_SIMAS|nr:anhydro-N-acetylmuramic acid kinase [Simiduia agarivorans]AFU99066.1 anhydro-N-acetylmuramic acid kinase [Simiduia agarivorans SA1 = DSM 21679]